jgi:hypothetical protein
MGELGWHRADNETEALEKATKDAERFSLGEYDHATTKIERVTTTARCPKTSNVAGAEGHYLAPGVDVPFGGACPIQGEGTLDGFPVYYRARGAGWSLSVTLSDNEEWTYGDAPYAWPDGGWLDAEESVANIRTATEAFRQHPVSVRKRPDQ